MKKNTFLVLCIMTAFSVAAQSYSETFYDALNSDNLSLQREILAEWGQASPDDIDLYIARFNYHMGQSIASSSPVAADSTVLVIDQAIQQYPDRLDLRFGKIFFLGEIRRWKPYADEIVQTLDRSEQINHRWQFPNLEGGGRELMLEGVQDYLHTISYDIANPEPASTIDTTTVLEMRRIAHRAAQVFPSDVIILIHLAYSHSIVGDYQNALHYLLRAEKIAPNNPVVLERIVSLYTKMKNKKLAAQYKQRLKALQPAD